MSLVDDDSVRAGAKEIIEPSVALNKVQTHNGEWVRIEDTCGAGQVSFKPRCCGCGHRGRIDRKLGVQFANPLLDEVRRAEDREAVDFTAIE